MAGWKRILSLEKGWMRSGRECKSVMTTLLGIFSEPLTRLQYHLRALTCADAFKPPLHFGPLAIQNAEVDGVAYAAGGRDQMAAKRAFFFGADAENRIARLLIERVCLQLDSHAFPDFEGVPQHEIFG